MSCWAQKIEERVVMGYGWIESEIFFPVVSSFIKYTKPTKEDRVILVLDMQDSHTTNLELITLA
jgi:hypothetical protein